MDAPVSQLVVFNLDDLQCALHLSAVERIERSVAVSPLPKAPEIVLGVINVRGRILPVMDMRKRFRLPPRPAGLDDHLIVARTSRREVVLLVDQVRAVASVAKDRLVPAQDILPDLAYVEGGREPGPGCPALPTLDGLTMTPGRGGNWRCKHRDS